MTVPANTDQLVLSGGITSPLDLFKSGEYGLIWDFQDLPSMFQDLSGTTPVTTAGQDVKLVRDLTDNNIDLLYDAGTTAKYNTSDIASGSIYLGSGDYMITDLISSDLMVNGSVILCQKAGSGDDLCWSIGEYRTGDVTDRIYLVTDTRNSPRRLVIRQPDGVTNNLNLDAETNTDPHIMSFITKADGVYGYFDGIEQTGSPISKTEVFAAGNRRLVLNSRSDFSSGTGVSPGFGNYVFLLAIDRAFTDQEFEFLLEYIAEKAGITL